ncbi:GSCFA domain-containing protein [Gimibacter soli]|uniref:GSCFA domain-containing protein n=1 Tax=Gimibacter soli TaxID=3024400 RepID=A0AAE9XUC0_9PROT|nr:GSCFA domain-containing protein [Gimibacter soli]WCL55146.1 GSCFA domain-containing protein [Gimibacter soli]
MPSKAISYDDALNTARNRTASWQHSLKRLDGLVFPELAPSFQFGAKDSLFTIGSCFARNIEEKLDVLGYDIPVLRFSVPKTEWKNRANGILNKFTPPAIWQEIDWAASQFENGDTFDPALAMRFAIRVDEGMVVDTNLQGFTPVTEARFLERRAELYDVFRTMFTAEGLIITLGLIEAWYDKETGVYIQQMPDKRTFGDTLGRFELHVLSFEESRKFIEDSIARVRALNPDVKVMITTSPVPLGRTFASHDVILATTHGKSLLRTVCADVTAKFDRVDYFPSYEAATITKTWDIWQEDKRHVSDEFVGQIVRNLIAGYFPESARDSILMHVHSRHGTRPSDEVLQDAYRQIEAATDNPDLVARLVTLLQETEDRADLEPAIDRALAAHPAHPALNGIKGQWLFGDKNTPAAERHLKLAVQDPETPVEMKLNYVRCLLASNDLAGAENMLAILTVEAPHRIYTHVLLGRLRMAQKRDEEALAAFAAALAIAPNNPVALKRHAEIQERLARRASAG